jgi:hypothetical protein
MLLRRADSFLQENGEILSSNCGHFRRMEKFCAGSPCGGGIVINAYSP